MTSELFLLKELLGSLKLKSWGLSLVAVVVAAIFLGVFTLFSFLIQPGSSGTGVQVLAIPGKDLSQSDLAALHQKLLDDPDIIEVRFVLPTLSAEVEEEKRSQSRFEITLRSDAQFSPVSERLMRWGTFQDIAPPGPDSLEAWRDWLQSSDRRWMAWTGLALLLGIALFALHGSLRAARRCFAGELELLEILGIAPQTLRIPFALVGFLYGLAGALLVGFVFDGLRAVLTLAFSWRPELWESTLIDQLGSRGFLLGLAFAGLGALLGWFSLQRYPSPFKRSRISSSSAAEVAET